MEKNVASQVAYVYAYNTATPGPETGAAATITAQISKDEGAAAATNDANPTELEATDHPGIYYFNLTQTETNADRVVITPACSDADVVLDPVVYFTRPPNFNVLGIASDGDISEVNLLTNYTGVSLLDISGAADGALIKYDGPTRTEATSDKDEILASIGTGYTTPSDATLSNQQAILASLGTGVSLLAISGATDGALIKYDSPTRAEATADKDEILASIGTGYATATLSNQQTILSRLGVPSGLDVSTELWLISGDTNTTNSRLTAARAGYFDFLNIGENVASSSQVSNLNDPSLVDISGAMAGTLVSYDGPTRTEATSDKDEILASIGTGYTTPSDATLANQQSILASLGTGVSLAEMSGAMDGSLVKYDSPTRAEATSDKDEVLASIGTGYTTPSDATLSNQQTILSRLGVPSGESFAYESWYISGNLGGGGGGTATLGNQQTILNYLGVPSGESLAYESWYMTGHLPPTYTGSNGDVFVLPSAPSDSSLTNVFGFFEDGQGLPVPCLPIDFQLVVPDDGAAKSDKILGQYTIRGTTDISGRLTNSAGDPYVTLQTNTGITPTGTYWKATSSDVRWTDKRLDLTSGSYDLSHLIT